jgi:hypothetical protein
VSEASPCVPQAQELAGLTNLDLPSTLFSIFPILLYYLCAAKYCGRDINVDNW